VLLPVASGGMAMSRCDPGARVPCCMLLWLGAVALIWCYRPPATATTSSHNHWHFH
jgi:hypothetical protein